MDLLKHCRSRTILTRRQNITAGCLNFAKSHFAIPDSGVVCLWQNFNNLFLILPPRQNNPVAAVKQAPNPISMQSFCKTKSPICHAVLSFTCIRCCRRNPSIGNNQEVEGVALEMKIYRASMLHPCSNNNNLFKRIPMGCNKSIFESLP